MITTEVLIVGAGPVGLTLAIDLAWRGVDVTVVEQRAAGEPPNVKCNQVSARSMEVYRRLGLAQQLRDGGLPADYPIDVVTCTTVTGIELSRLSFPSRRGRSMGQKALDSSWPTPEPSHRINQTYFEPILFAHAAAQDRIRIYNRSVFESYVQDDEKIVSHIRNLDSGEMISIASKFMVGCDGGSSKIRKMIGANFTGVPEIQRVQSTYIHAPDLMELLGPKPAWMYFTLNPRRCGTVIAIDGQNNWNIHNFLYSGEPSYESIDRDWAIREILGVGPDFKYEVISKEDWMGRRLVADKFRDGRAFICGDACHIWIPAAGYGMNAGIADAADLAWMLAGVIEGWAALNILDAYEAERQPITDQASKIITDVALRVMKQRREIPAEIEAPGPIGDQTRAKLAQEAHELEVRQQCAAGLNFGYFYDHSPIIAYDDEIHPSYSVHEFVPSTVPGCRAPHLWLADGASLYDKFGPYFTLVRTDPTVEVTGFLDAAERRRLPLAVLDVGTNEAKEAYSRKLTLVRPDQHVAWRGDEPPTGVLGLIDLVRGEQPSKATEETQGYRQ
jgi:2-polyprenyl-6-methoxyphenol hydroxylase-like FAD-dependent oxidoreductase